MELCLVGEAHSSEKQVVLLNPEPIWIAETGASGYECLGPWLTPSTEGLAAETQQYEHPKD